MEFAHTNLNAIDAAQMRKSVDVAKAVAAHLGAAGHDVMTAVLLDDKTVTVNEKHGRSKAFLGLIDELGLAPNQYISESSLRQWLPQLSGLLPRRQQVKLRHATDDYITRFDTLPCSVDIALWHTLRLGLLGEAPIPPADVVVSILGDGNREFEELARRHFLEFIGHDVVARIVTLYYPESPDAPANIHPLLDQLEIALKEAPCPAS